MNTRNLLEIKAKYLKKLIIFVNGDKGGVGKSIVARILAALLIRYSYSVIGIDGDARNGHLERFQSGVMPVSRPYLRVPAGWDALFADWNAAPDDSVILIDLPGNVGDALERQMHRMQEIAEALERKILHVWVMDEEEDSITLLNRVKNLAAPERTLIVLNGRFADSPSAFVLWAESQLRAELLAAGAMETYVPAMPIRPRTKIARARCSFSDVTSACFETWEQVDFRIWWNSVETALSGFCKQVGLQ